MLHLHPNAVMILASFAYACEPFVGVMPSVALFRHYFVPRLGKSKWIAGGGSFRRSRSAAHQYLELKLCSCWDEWSHNWYFISEENSSPHLLLPSSPAERLANSKEISSQELALLPAIEQLAELHDRKLTYIVITGDFIR